ncbi:ATP10 protein-domain-containing protein [Kockovaella imperatae]|uniref:ATP10 protein-domain-containing protein n=1 Tax=Kockovaella imperatae TaxID=4999 RepID=A0A1Y1UKS0_9TREE|nr:ATP10 protein-domain-containing protein [Kockovaella imperatae]ORX38658.1 ATP10 protein-domain-containing protein [Kockovaella imperatae]
MRGQALARSLKGSNGSLRAPVKSSVAGKSSKRQHTFDCHSCFWSACGWTTSGMSTRAYSTKYDGDALLASVSAFTPSPDPSSSPSTASSSSTSKGKGNPPEIKELSRPLGSLERPVASSKTYQKVDNSMDRKKEQRAYLLGEVSKGYFHDFNRASKANSAKGWMAPKVLIREDSALYLPNIAGHNILGQSINTTELCEGKVTLVAFVSTKVAEEQVKRFVEPVLQDQTGKKGFNYVEINHQENQLKGILVGLFSSTLKSQVPEDRWSSYMLSRGEWSPLDISMPLGYSNKIVGYVYLVDPNCKIRWAACSAATPEEIHSLRTATEVLMKRVGEGKSRR